MSIQLFKKWTQAVVNSDWDSMSSLYAEDIVNLNPDGTTNVGKEACLEKDKGWDSAFSDFKFDVVNSMESGNTTVMEVQITFTMTGEMMTPDGSKILPTGKTHTFPYLYDYGMGEESNQETKKLRRLDILYGGFWNNALLIWREILKIR